MAASASPTKFMLKPIAGPILGAGDGIPVDLSGGTAFMISRFPKLSAATTDTQLGDFEGTPCLYVRDPYLSFPHSVLAIDPAGRLTIRVAHSRVRNPIFINVAGDLTPEKGVTEGELNIGDRVQLATSVFALEAVADTGWAAIFAKAYPDLNYLGQVGEDDGRGYTAHRTRSREGFTIAVECQHFDGSPAEIQGRTDELLRRLRNLKDKQAEDKAVAAVTPRIYDVRLCEIPGAGTFVFLAREPIDAPSLHAMCMAEQTPMPVPTALRFGIKLCEALHNFHRYGLHRNLLPETVHFIEGDSPATDRVVLGGIFWAKQETGGVSLSEMKMNLNLVFRPPEQLDHDEYTERSDLYAVALLIGVALSGQPPYSAKRLPELVQQVSLGSPDLPADVPARLKAVLTKAWAKKPNQRFHMMLDLRRQLSRLHDAMAPSGK